MSQAPTEAGTGRVAVIGASTVIGDRIREALAVLGIPGDRVNLYGTTSGEAVISEYDGEARLVQPPEISEISAHDLVFLCEEGGLADNAIRTLPLTAVLIDLVGALPIDGSAPLIHMDINPDAAGGHRGRLAVPSSLGVVLADLLAPLHPLGLRSATGLVLRPAADFGEDGVEELRRQSVGLMSFGEVPTEVLGRSFAFSVLTPRQAGREESEDVRLTDELGRLFEPAPSVSVRSLHVPTFYGHGIQLHLEFADAMTVDRLEQALSGKVEIDETATPLQVAAESRIRIAEIAEDRRGGAWIWCVVGELSSRGAEHAVRLARKQGLL